MLDNLLNIQAKSANLKYRLFHSIKEALFEG